MEIRPDEVNRIAVDRYVSTSGRYLMVLCERHERGKKCFDMVAMDAANHRVRKIVRLAVDDQILAVLKWEYYKQAFTAKSENEEQEQEFVRMSTAAEVFKSLEDGTVALKMKPRGARLFVQDIQPIDEVTARAQDAGLHIVVADEHKPKPTMAIVLAVGEDPLMQELYRVGDIVMFSKHAGTTFTEAGAMFRSLEQHEIIGVRDKADGIEDIVGKQAEDQKKEMRG